MKRILFLIDTLETGGAEKSLLAIIPALPDVEPVVVVLYKGLALADQYRQRGVKVIALEHPGRYDFSLLANRVSRIVDEVRPVIIHSTLFRADIVSRKVRKRFPGIKLINSLVNNTYSSTRYSKLGLSGKFKLAMVQILDAFTISHVDAFISNSVTIKESSIRTLRIKPDKIEVIYRGRDKGQFQNISPAAQEGVRKELSIGATTKVVLNVSRLLDRKGQLDLLKAFNSVQQTVGDILLVIAGEGPYRPTLQKFIDENALSAKVKLVGSRDDVPVLLAVANVFAFPSYYEGIPGALIESMFAKKVIVASDIPENCECINDSCALIFPVGNVAELAKQLLMAITATNDFDKKCELAYEAAIRKFELGSVVQQYGDFYKRIL